ncbi:MAG: hydrogenase/urease maturation nickel metallochaperone HypA [Acidobacteriota bacterium]
MAEDEALSPESLDFHFRAHARGTAAEGAALALELRHVPAHCRGCGASFAPEHHLHLCPACGSGDVELSGPTGLSIESITLA